ncbi:unnamed protein product [Linum trigynum]|uniref:Uncharacterized protein n=1 Tax=Linum trigynum TaxID=586398 RepID=A0AAV2FYZ0_9ROSI
MSKDYLVRIEAEKEKKQPDPAYAPNSRITLAAWLTSGEEEGQEKEEESAAACCCSAPDPEFWQPDSASTLALTWLLSCCSS